MKIIFVMGLADNARRRQGNRPYIDRLAKRGHDVAVISTGVRTS